MPRWLDPNYIAAPFVLFGPAHLAALAVTALACGWLVWLCRRPGLTEGRRAALRYLIVALLLGAQAVWDIWQVTVGIWTVGWSLPLHVCQLSQLLCAIMLLWRSNAMFQVLYFWAAAGVLQALLTPNIAGWGFPHIGYWVFFISHGATVLAITYMIAAEGQRPTWRGLAITFVATNLLLPLIWLINRLTSGNYWFVTSPPSTPSLIDYMGPWPWYLLSAQAVALLIFALALLPFEVPRWRRRAREVSLET